MARFNPLGMSINRLAIGVPILLVCLALACAAAPVFAAPGGDQGVSQASDRGFTPGDRHGYGHGRGYRHRPRHGYGRRHWMRTQDKIVIAHRGAPGYLPEHTLPGYAMAYALGADFIEPDLVMTSDKRLICLHDIHLESTTDVETKFPDRARDDGRWYAADFTLAEIEQLNVTERTNPDGTRVFPGRFNADARGFKVPTFRAMVELVASLNRETHRSVGIYPETKDPAFHDDEGLPLERKLLDTLAEYGYAGRDAKVYVQSFDPDNLKEMRFAMGSDLPQIQLIAGSGEEYDALVTPEGLDDIATYADGIGPDKNRIADTGGALVSEAHQRGLKVHPYTFRADELPADTRRLEDELNRYYFRYDVDGLFTDFTDVAVGVLRPNYNPRLYPE